MYEILNIFRREVAIALSPSLAENEMRIVLSWETSQDLDIYALQMDKYTSWNKSHTFSVEELTFKRQNSPKKKISFNVVQ